MSGKNIQNVRKRKRLRQKRRAWAAAAMLFIFILAVDFLGGFLTGSIWQKKAGHKDIPKDLAADTAFASGTWENAANCDEQDIDGQDSGIWVQNARNDGAAGEVMQINTSDMERNLILVNGWNPVPDNFEVNLVEVEGGERVDRQIYEPLMEMLYDAREANWEQIPHVVSGYRTVEKQQQLYDEKIAGYKRQGYSESEAEKMAQEWVAVPGYSEHQLGLAVDINGATYDVYLWLQENSYKYGFIFRYQGHKTEITKVAEEVWHYRYVGVEAATEIYEQGICLEEYVESRSL